MALTDRENIADAVEFEYFGECTDLKMRSFANLSHLYCMNGTGKGVHFPKKVLSIVRVIYSPVQSDH